MLAIIKRIPANLVNGRCCSCFLFWAAIISRDTCHRCQDQQICCGRRCRKFHSGQILSLCKNRQNTSTHDSSDIQVKMVFFENVWQQSALEVAIKTNNYCRMWRSNFSLQFRLDLWTNYLTHGLFYHFWILQLLKSAINSIKSKIYWVLL